MIATFRCDSCLARFEIEYDPSETSPAEINSREIECEPCWHKREDREAEEELTRLPLWAHPDYPL